MEPGKPAEVIRDGNLKASIWRNQNENGAYYTATFSRSYKDENNNWHDSQTFFRNDLLRIIELGRQAYGRIAELGREHSREREPEQRSEKMSREAFKGQRRQGDARANGLSQEH